MRSVLLRSMLGGAAAVGLATMACGDGTAPDTECTAEQPVELHVSDGRTPTFTWTPACGMQMLQVFNLSIPGEPEIWSARPGPSAPRNWFGPGVRYGQTPEGGAARPAHPLSADMTYRVSLSRWVGDSAQGRMQGATSVVFRR